MICMDFIDRGEVLFSCNSHRSNKCKAKALPPASNPVRSWESKYVFLAIYYLQFFFNSRPSVFQVIQGFQSFRQLCKIIGEQSAKRMGRMLTVCVICLQRAHVRFQDILSLLCWVWWGSSPCSVLSHQIPVRRDSAAVWGLIRPMLEDIHFDWIHYGELFCLFDCMAAF